MLSVWLIPLEPRQIRDKRTIARGDAKNDDRVVSQTPALSTGPEYEVEDPQVL